MDTSFRVRLTQEQAARINGEIARNKICGARVREGDIAVYRSDPENGASIDVPSANLSIRRGNIEINGAGQWPYSGESFYKLREMILGKNDSSINDLDDILQRLSACLSHDANTSLVFCDPGKIIPVIKDLKEAMLKLAPSTEAERKIMINMIESKIADYFKARDPDPIKDYEKVKALFTEKKRIEGMRLVKNTSTKVITLLNRVLERLESLSRSGVLDESKMAANHAKISSLLMRMREAIIELKPATGAGKTMIMESLDILAKKDGRPQWDDRFKKYLDTKMKQVGRLKVK